MINNFQEKTKILEIKIKKLGGLFALPFQYYFSLLINEKKRTAGFYFLALIFSKSCFRVSSLLFVNSKGELVKGSK